MDHTSMNLKIPKQNNNNNFETLWAAASLSRSIWQGAFSQRKSLFIAQKAMTSLQNSIILILRIGILVIFSICSRIIWKYLKRKPLGMQTMLDPMLLELLPQSWTLLIISTIQFFISAYLYPIDEKVAHMITLSYAFFVCGFLLHNLITGLIQASYFLASNPLYDIEDETIGKNFAIY